MSIVITFFRDFLDGWIYILYFIICLGLIFLCIKLLIKNRKNLINSSISSNNSNGNNISTIAVDDTQFKYSGDIFDDKK